ncbi:hypothetical protein BDU57DRAFT_75780 [Ampelomyces quisqualis]|uniref:Uncharacterized protein n=1 Tax=Ampelomyces quisqualis TaxID=50730 RepID=A0A6A5QBU9_AMPQU|nr:hypothetical protein BDU57DRAFT_75780 [Ampelomyces quisqualis]
MLILGLPPRFDSATCEARTTAANDCADTQLRSQRQHELRDALRTPTCAVAARRPPHMIARDLGPIDTLPLGQTCLSPASVRGPHTIYICSNSALHRQSAHIHTTNAAATGPPRANGSPTQCSAQQGSLCTDERQRDASRHAAPVKLQYIHRNHLARASRPVQ